jgi:putative alpha-1,2-mannosidase
MNLKSEAEPYGFDFDKVSQAASGAWNRLLSRIEVQGGSADDRTKLYTSLYRAYTGKALLDDVDGTYRGACGEVQHIPVKGEHVYSSDALWGAQWTLGPLWALLNPELTDSFNAALLLGAEREGWLP